MCVCFCAHVKATNLDKELVIQKKINLGNCQPGQRLHRGSMKAFLNQNYIAKDFWILGPKFQAAIPCLQQMDYLPGQNNFPIDQGQQFPVHL